MRNQQKPSNSFLARLKVFILERLSLVPSSANILLCLMVLLIGFTWVFDLYLSAATLIGLLVCALCSALAWSNLILAESVLFSSNDDAMCEIKINQLLYADIVLLWRSRFCLLLNAYPVETDRLAQFFPKIVVVLNNPSVLSSEDYSRLSRLFK